MKPRSGAPRPDPALAGLLERRRDDLLALVRREGRGLLRHEGEEDLVQGIQLRALGMEGRFEMRGEKEALGWLLQVGRRFLADRHDYWKAQRRDAGLVLRLTSGFSTTRATRGGVEPAATATGPGTVALRREQIALALRVLATLPSRDRDLVRWMSQGTPIEEIAGRLDLSYDAAKHAQARAVERFRKAFDLVSRRVPTRRPTSTGPD